MFLKQAEARFAQLQRQQQKPKLVPPLPQEPEPEPPPPPPEPEPEPEPDLPPAAAKVIGLKVPPELRIKLDAVKERRGLRSVRATALLALEAGADILLGEK